MWLHLQLSLTWRLLKFGWALFSIFRHTSVECCFRATPLLPRRAGRSCRAPARISVLLFPLLCMPQGAIMQNADGNPACWPNWDHPYLVLHAPHALLRAWCHELWHGHCYRLDTVGLHKVQPTLIKFSAPQLLGHPSCFIASPFLLCVQLGRWWVWFPQEDTGRWRGLLNGWIWWPLLQGKVQVGSGGRTWFLQWKRSEDQQQIEKGLFSSDNDGNKDDKWQSDLGSVVGGEQWGHFLK